MKGWLFMASITQLKNLYAFVDNPNSFLNLRLEQLLCLSNDIVCVAGAL